jgi:hypothetical protein
MHQHWSGMETVKIGLSVIVVLGTANLAAMKYKDKSSLAASWCNLFGLS